LNGPKQGIERPGPKDRYARFVLILIKDMEASLGEPLFLAGYELFLIGTLAGK